MRTIIYTAILGWAFLSGCKKEEAPTITTADVTNSATVYPAPPAKWFGGAKPYYLQAGFVGDVMPYFEGDSFHIFYLHDARDGAAGFHPWNKFTTKDLTSYTYDGTMIPYGGTADQDLALGTGSIVKIGDTYYAYYSGFNPAFNGSSGKFRDVILQATSKDLTNWTKTAGFIIKPETENGYDSREFRDPYVFFNTEKGEYWLLQGGRKDGKAAVMLYTSATGTGAWQLKDPLYTDAAYYIPETPQLLKWGSTWYLIFSENSVENTTRYRTATSSSGPWTTPAADKLDGAYMYASKIASNSTDTYLFGWCPTKSGSSDGGNRDFGGNLVVHRLTQNSDGTLNVTVPAAVEGVFTKPLPLNLAIKRTDIAFEGTSVSFKNTSDEALILFERLNGSRMITATVSGVSAGSEFGFIFGMDKGLQRENHFRISLSEADDKVSGMTVVNNSPRTDGTVSLSLQPGTEHKLKLILQGSVCVLYVDDKVALTSRIYSANNNLWGFFARNGNIVFKDIKVSGQ